jgi:hypothetical protein
MRLGACTVSIFPCPASATLAERALLSLLLMGFNPNLKLPIYDVVKIKVYAQPVLIAAKLTLIDPLREYSVQPLCLLYK